jgi:hypothetical protein
MSGTPPWVTAVIALASAWLGFWLRATWEEMRDFRASRRIVVSELKRCERALRAAEFQPAGRAEMLSDTAYRSSLKVFALYLPEPLWHELENIYSLFPTDARKDPAELVKNQKDLARKLSERIEAAIQALSGTRIWHLVAPWTRSRYA